MFSPVEQPYCMLHHPLLSLTWLGCKNQRAAVTDCDMCKRVVLTQSLHTGYMSVANWESKDFK